MKEYYKVEAGDTLKKIASKYNTTYQVLAKYNNIKDPDTIIIGDIIIIPKLYILGNNIGSILGMIIVVVIIGAVILFIGKVIFSYLTNIPVCETVYNYVDMDGKRGRSKDCKNSFGTLYCGDDNNAKIVKEVNIERICNK